MLRRMSGRLMRSVPFMSGGTQSYINKVLGYSPIGYWPLNETSGITAFDLSGNGFNGTYNGPTLANGVAPDGSPCPFFDGNNDLVDIFSAGLAAAFDGGEFTFACWAKVFNAGVWTDGNKRNINIIRKNPGDYTYIRKADAGSDNDMEWTRDNGGFDQKLEDITLTDWYHVCLTVSETDDEFIAYRDGSSLGTRGGLGAWADTIDNALIGANIGPQHFWYGWLAHPVLLDRAMTPAEVADIASSPF